MFPDHLFQAGGAETNLHHDRKGTTLFREAGRYRYVSGLGSSDGLILKVWKAPMRFILTCGSRFKLGEYRA